MEKMTKKRVLHTLQSEIEAVSGLKKVIQKDFFNALSVLDNRQGKIIVTGVGKSGFIGMKIAATLTSLGHTAVYLHPVEALHGDTGVVQDGDVIVGLSFSGESQEVVKIATYLKKVFSVSLIAITGNKKSSLAKVSDETIHIVVDTEGCPLNLAPMASTTATLVVGDLLAAGLTKPETFQKKEFAKYHPGGSLGLSLTLVADAMSPSVVCIHQDTAFKNMLERMSDKHLGFVGIEDSKGKLVGIVTDGDVRRYLIEHDLTDECAAKNIMTKNPKSIEKNATLQEALVLMETFRIFNMFVVENDKPVGHLHIHDIVNNYVI